MHLRNLFLKVPAAGCHHCLEAGPEGLADWFDKVHAHVGPLLLNGCLHFLHGHVGRSFTALRTRPSLTLSSLASFLIDVVGDALISARHSGQELLHPLPVVATATLLPLAVPAVLLYLLDIEHGVLVSAHDLGDRVRRPLCVE